VIRWPVRRGLPEADPKPTWEVVMNAARCLACLLLALSTVVTVGARGGTAQRGPLRFLAPEGLLSEVGRDVPFSLRLPPSVSVADLRIEVDGAPVPASDYARAGRHLVAGALRGHGAGPHRVEAIVHRGHGRGGPVWRAESRFELLALDRPEVCEVLNQVECLLPYPSSRYLVPADTVTGVRLDLPEDAMPRVVLEGNLVNLLPGGVRAPLDPTPYNTHDGFSPTVQILMHFPGGVDLERSRAPRLLPETRSFDLRSLERDSPTVLIDAETRERIAHFVENDAHATGSTLARQVSILRPARSLDPGHRYIVAVRNLVHADGSPVEAEPAFEALRDRRPTDIPALDRRRAPFEEIFRTLARAGVRRDELVLAFDFVVQSDEQLTGEMLSMRDQAFAFLEAHDGGRTTFDVDEVRLVNPGCADPDQPVWKEVRGSFQAPLFLDADNIAEPRVAGRLQLDAAGRPLWTATTDAPFGIAIPCKALEGGGTPLHPLVVGHGLFGNGPDTLSGLVGAEELSDLAYVAGATNWSGLSSLDVSPLPPLPGDIEDVLSDPQLLGAIVEFFGSFIGQMLIDFDRFPAMADRLRQGQLNTLVLARMLATGAFHANPEFRTPEGVGVIDTSESFYFGASLGGIMGIMFGALSPDVERLNVDVPAINFSLLLQRATPFIAFETFLNLIEPDPNVTLLTLALLHERWVRGESAGYATHVTRNPLPGTNAKRVLMTVALFDQQVANLGSQIAGATLGLRNLEGSVVRDLPLVPDRSGPLPSAYVVYDTGSFDPENPAHAPFIPPLVNLAGEPNRCDPHGRRGFIPASVEQLLGFLRPGGEIENFCNGLCDAAEPFEIPFGDDAPCDPLD
jgi:hypothetical protein